MLETTFCVTFRSRCLTLTWRSCGRTCCSSPRQAGPQCRWSRQRRSAWLSRSSIPTCRALTWKYVPSSIFSFLKFRKKSHIMTSYSSEIFTNLEWCRGEALDLPLQAWSPLNWCWYYREFHSWSTWSIDCALYTRVSQKTQKSEFWNVTYPSGFHRLDKPPEKISAL